MFAWLERAWRVTATGICFLCFGIGGVVLGVLVFPASRLVFRDAERRSEFGKRIIHGSFRRFIRLMAALGVLSYEFHGLERLTGRGLLILANHPSLIDVVFLIAHVENADCIVKGELGRNPFTRGPVRAAGYVCNDQGGDMLDDCVRSLRRGNNLIVFPEGTRTRSGQPLKLHRGAARVALRAGVDITPVRIRCDPPTLGKGEKWYKIPHRRVHFRFDVDEPVPVMGFVDSTDAISARRLTEFLAHHLSTETEIAPS